MSDFEEKAGLSVRDSVAGMQRESIMEHLDDICGVLGVNPGFATTDEKLVEVLRLCLFGGKSLENPAITFTQRAKAGWFNALSDKEYNELMAQAKQLSRFWWDRREARTFDIAKAVIMDLESGRHMSSVAAFNSRCERINRRRSEEDKADGE